MEAQPPRSGNAQVPPSQPAGLSTPFAWQTVAHTVRLQPSLLRRALRIVVLYAVFALAWIYLSDRVAGALYTDPEALTRIAIYKGFAFVAVTAAVLLALIVGVFQRLDHAYRLLDERKAESERFSRLFEALSEANHAGLWAGSRDDLFRQVCEALVRHGGFQMAWVGWGSDPPGWVVPVAEYGDRDGYLQKITISTQDDELGRGGTGTAFRTARPSVRNDLLADTASTPWREHMRKHGYRSSAGFPIREGSEVRGVLTVYAGEAGYFQPREIELLNRAAANVSYAIDRFRRRRLREQAEHQARAERELSQAMIESMPGLVFLLRDDLRYLRWNRNTETVTGYSASEIAGMHALDFFDPAVQPLMRRRVQHVFEQGEASVEAPLRLRDGRQVPYLFTGRRIEVDGEPCMLGMGVAVVQRAAGAADSEGGPEAA